MIKTIFVNNKPFREDYERQAEVLNEQRTQFTVNKLKMDNDTIYKCDSRGMVDPDDPGFFIPVEAGRLSP